RGALWVLPTLSVLAALAAGAALSSVSVGPRSPLAFQGTPDDARTLLLGITGTMITIIALLLGLAVVALQLSSTQFSPRLLRNFLAVIEDGLLTGGQEAPEVPAWAVPVVSRHSGYVQAVRPGRMLPCAVRHGVCLRLRPRVGEHVVAETTLAWIWRISPEDPAPDPAAFTRALDTGVRIGFERTLQQDAAFGIRQLVDVACKALSPAVN